MSQSYDGQLPFEPTSGQYAIAMLVLLNIPIFALWSLLDFFKGRRPAETAKPHKKSRKKGGKEDIAANRPTSAQDCLLQYTSWHPKVYPEEALYTWLFSSFSHRKYSHWSGNMLALVHIAGHISLFPEYSSADAAILVVGASFASSVVTWQFDKWRGNEEDSWSYGASDIVSGLWASILMLQPRGSTALASVGFWLQWSARLKEATLVAKDVNAVIKQVDDGVGHGNHLVAFAIGALYGLWMRWR